MADDVTGGGESASSAVEPHPRTRSNPARDALTTAPDASYDAQGHRAPMSGEDRELVESMLGRPARGRPAAAVRCGWGLPAVLRVDPRLEDGTPFPTTFWLSCPLANRSIGTLEATQTMREWSTRLSEDAEALDGYIAAHGRYVAFRDGLGPPVPGDPSAGGMPTRIKCLLALYGHHLACDDNPVGRWVAERVEPLECPAPCVRLDGDGWYQ